jgi:hypothetical protein
MAEPRIANMKLHLGCLDESIPERLYRSCIDCEDACRRNSIYSSGILINNTYTFQSRFSICVRYASGEYIWENVYYYLMTVVFSFKSVKYMLPKAASMLILLRKPFSFLITFRGISNGTEHILQLLIH